MTLTLIIAIASVGFLLAYLFFKTGEEYDKHFLLRLLLLGCLFGIFVLLGKVGLDSQNTCDLVMNETLVDGNLSTYSYEAVCYDVTQYNTGLTFYKLTLWIVRLLSAYILIYFFYELFMWLSKVIRGVRGRSR
jgi:hypothetical protein